MKRRRFLQAVAAAPAVPLAAQQAAQQAAQTGARPAPGGAPAAGTAGQFRGPQPEQALETTAADIAAEAVAPSFFSADQFAALRRLGSLLQPPLSGHPGAAEAGAPEFLDFLIGASPADRQKLYREGLDGLNAQAQKQHKRPFASLDEAQADAIVRPYLVVIAWPEDLPPERMRRFLAQAQRDFRTATQNSREWANAGASSGRRGGRRSGGGMGLYWLPIDPVKG